MLPTWCGLVEGDPHQSWQAVEDSTGVVQRLPAAFFFNVLYGLVGCQHWLYSSCQLFIGRLLQQGRGREQQLVAVAPCQRKAEE